MKKYSLSVLLLLGFTINFARNIFPDLSETQIKEMICHQWKLSFLEYNGVKKEIPSKLPPSILSFVQNGKMLETDGKNKYEGKWNYIHTVHTITTTDKDGTEHHKIIQINDKELIMDGKFMGRVFNMGFSRID